MSGNKGTKNCLDFLSRFCRSTKDSKHKINENTKYEQKKMLIFYGTQTTTSEDFAQNFLQDSIEKFGFTSQVVNMFDFEEHWESLKKGDILTVFLLSSYGEGEPTTDSVKFFEYICECQNPKELENLDYVIFGLGDSRYRKYQGMCDKTNENLKRLGANLLFKVGYGDADKYIEDDFDDWRFSVLEFLCEKFRTRRNIVELSPVPRYEIIWKNPSDNIDDDRMPFKKIRMRPTPETPFLSKVIKKSQLIKNESGNLSTQNIVLNINKARIRYQAGDHFAVYPPNPRDLIDAYLKRLGISKSDMQKVLSLKPLDVLLGSRSKFLKETTLENVFKYYLDLSSTPRRKQVRLLAEYAKNKKDKKVLMKITSRSKWGKKNLRSRITDKKKRILDILEEYKSIELPLNVFLEITPIQQVRLYSIASSFKSNKKVIELCVGLENYIAFNGRKGVGICSAFLTNLKENESCYCYVRKSNFYMDDLEKPVIFVANGTGIASIRSFIQRRKWFKEKRDETLGKAVVFFGCRNKNGDWLYQEEQEEALKNGVISNLYCAFSRDQKKKIYVQNLIEKNSEEVKSMIKNGASVFVCGKMAMSKGVMAAIEKCLESVYDKKGIDDFFDNRYNEDVYD